MSKDAGELLYEEITRLTEALKVVAVREARQAVVLAHLKGERDKALITDPRQLMQMLAEYRYARQLSQADVARRAGQASSWVHKMEKVSYDFRFGTILSYIHAVDGELRLWLPEVGK